VACSLVLESLVVLYVVAFVLSTNTDG
jgi:hypothetical protein